MEKLLIETLKTMGATRKMIAFIDRNFLHYDNATVQLLQVIEKAVVEFYQSDRVMLYQVTRKRSVVGKRQIMHWLGRKYTRGSFALIGDLFGMKDHATVIHSVRTVNNLMETDEVYRKEVEDLDKCVNQKLNTTELWPNDSPTP